MEGFDLLDSQIFSELDIYALRQMVWNKIHLDSFSPNTQCEKEIGNIIFNHTLRFVEKFIKEKGYVLTKKGGEEDG
jgi:hypothetical protein